MTKTVLVAESNAYLLEVLSELLKASGFAVAGETTQKSDVVNMARALKPDLLIYDFNLSDEGIGGLAELQTVKKELPRMKILVLGFQDATEEFVDAVLKYGCDAFCNKFESQTGLLGVLNMLVAPG